jgi:type IV pilus assembly protein PilP
VARPAVKAPANTGAAPFYQYSASGKADPFKPFMETDINVIKKRAEAIKQKRDKEIHSAISPLQREEIDKFTLVGIIGDQKKRKAIVEDKKEKRHYPLFLGTYIGKNGGRVAEILADRVIVEEIVNADQKKTKKRQVNRIEMLLHKDE